MVRSPWVAFGGVIFLCIGFLAWSQFHHDPEDTSWLDVDVPPAQAALVMPGVALTDTPPMGIGGPMRHRRYPATLSQASISVIGTIGGPFA
jgi:hypothetical protein